MIRSEKIAARQSKVNESFYPHNTLDVTHNKSYSGK